MRGGRVGGGILSVVTGNIIGAIAYFNSVMSKGGQGFFFGCGDLLCREGYSQTAGWPKVLSRGRKVGIINREAASPGAGGWEVLSQWGWILADGG